MITEQDLQAAIAECQGERHPTANTCLKLASYYIIQDKMFGRKEEDKVEHEESYSFSKSPTLEPDGKVTYSSGTEFSSVIFGMDTDFVFGIVDELMSVLETTNPRLYNGVIRKLKS